MISKTPILTLQGRANKNILDKLKITTHISSVNKAWFFADYSTHDIALHTSFDVLLEGDNKQLARNKATVRIIAIIDQFGHKLPSVPEGFKTICRLEFSPNIPVKFKKLQLLSKWQYNPESLTLAQHQGIEMGTPDTILVNLYNIAYGRLKEEALKSKFFNNPTKTEFLKIAKQSLNTDAENSERMLQTFLQMGKIKQKNNELRFEEVK